MLVQVLIIAVWVIVIKIILDAFLPEISRDLGPYVGLIITNCIVMGRTEGYALANKPLDSFYDGVGAGVGYTMVLLTIALVREPLGLGTLFGYQVIPEGWTRWNLMIIAPSGFFALATFIWVARWLKDPTVPPAGTPAAGSPAAGSPAAGTPAAKKA
jgi:Na+-transporting NADH:ubiquinone oxidoreductase subunit D